MALKIVGSNPTTHPTKKKDFHKKSFFFILGCSQVVRHHTLTVAFRWFESIQPNQDKLTNFAEKFVNFLFYKYIIT